MQNPARAAVVTQQHIRIVFEFAARQKRRELGAERFDLQAGDITAKIFRVRADVAHAAGRAGALRFAAPRGLLVIGDFEAVEQPALCIFGDDFQNFSEPAAADEFARLFHHRIAGVIVRERENFSRLAHEFAQRLGFFQIQGHRLVANDVKAAFQKSCRDWRVQKIRRDDGNKINALIFRQFTFAPRHFLVARINPAGIEEKLPARDA